MTSNRPRPLSDLVPGLTKGIFGSKNMLFGKLLTEWLHVAGAEIADRTRPLELKFARKADNKNNQAVLHLAVAPGYALELSYQKALLIERLNVYFGYPAIKDIKIVQYSEVMSGKPPPATAVSRPLSAEEDRQIDGIVARFKKTIYKQP